MAKVHHSAIVTRDVVASLGFWRDGLGFEVLMDETFAGPWPELFGATSPKLRSVFLGEGHEPDSGIVELVDIEGTAPPVILEAQAAYILSALRHMRWRRARSVEVRRDVMAQYNREIADALEDTIWHDGCQSYFKNENGKIATQLPQTSQWYAKRTKRFRMKEYVRT